MASIYNARFDKAIEIYTQRDRRYGALSPVNINVAQNINE